MIQSFLALNCEMNSDEYQKIYKYLKYGKIPLELDTSHSRFGFKRKCRGYEIDEGRQQANIS